MCHAVIALVLFLTALLPGIAGGQAAPRRVSLEEAVQLFAAQNSGLRALRAAGAAEVGLARAIGVAPNPVVGVTRESISEGDLRAGESYVTLSLPMRWPWVGTARRQVTGHTRDWVAAQRRADSLTLVQSVQEAYVDAWLAEQRIQIIDQLVALVDQVHEDGALRFAAGDLSGLDLRRLSLEQARYRQLRSSSELAVTATRRALAALILTPSDAQLVAPADLPAPAAADVAWSGDTTAVVRGHPRVAAAREAVRLAEAAERVEAGLRLPPPTVTAGYKHQDDGLQGLFVGAAIPVPLFDRRSGGREATRAEAEVAMIRLAQVEREVRDRLAQALARQAAGAALLEHMRAAAPSPAMDLVEMALAAYREGEYDVTALLATAEAWRELGTLGAEARAEYWRSEFELFAALGGAELGRTTSEARAR